MKYKTINNHVSRRLVRHILNNDFDRFITLLYNYRDGFEDSAFSRLLKFCFDLLDDDARNVLCREVVDNFGVQYTWFSQIIASLYIYKNYER